MTLLAYGANYRPLNAPEVVTWPGNGSRIWILRPCKESPFHPELAKNTSVKLFRSSSERRS